MATVMNKHKAQTRKNTPTDLPAIRADHAHRAAALQDLAHRVEQLEHNVQLARGTREIPAGFGAPEVDMTAEVETRQLYHDVETLLSQRPHTFRELMTALGAGRASENRVKGVMVRLQHPDRGALAAVNLGNGARALWWIDTQGRIEAIARARRSR